MGRDPRIQSTLTPTLSQGRGRRRPPALLLIACLTTVLLCGAPLLAQETFTDAVSVVAVEVPVQVVRGDDPVQGLGPESFELTWNGKPQTLSDFETIDLLEPASRTEATPVLQTAARRHFLILFDLSFSNPLAIVRARDAARDLVLNALHPTDLVGVALYSEGRGMQLLVGFTSDRSQVELAIRSLGAKELYDQSMDPLGLTLGRERDLFPDSREGTPGSDAPGAGRPGGGRSIHNEWAMAHIRELQMVQLQTSRQKQYGRLAAMSSAYQELAKLLGGLDGRKHVVLLSEGFDAMLLRGTETQYEINEMNEAAEYGETWKVDSDKRFGSTRTMSNITDMITALQRADCTVQAVDISGLREGGGRASSGQDSLFMVADETGGSLYANTNELDKAMGEMLRRTAVTYLLTFQPQNIPADGSYQKLRVEVKDQPRGTQVIYRDGFFAPRSFQDKSPDERRLEAAADIMSGQNRGDVRAALLTVPLPGAHGVARVPVLLELNGSDLLEIFQTESPSVELFLYAIGADGGVADFAAEQMQLDLSRVRPALQRSGLKLYAELVLPAGEYSLRTMVREMDSGESALAVADVEIPVYPVTEPILLPPLFPDAAGTWLTVRARPRDGSGSESDFPFRWGGQIFLPGTRPVMGGGSEHPMALLVGGLRPDAELSIAADLMGPPGSSPQSVQVKQVAVPPQEGGAPSDGLLRLFAVINPPDRPGDYILRVTVGDGEREAVSSLPMTLVAPAG